MKRTLLAGAMLSALATPAFAQIERPQITGQPKRPIEGLHIVQPLPRPTIKVNGGGTVKSRTRDQLRVVIGGVPNARAYHLFSFDPGCQIDAEPGVSGYNLFVQGAGRYKTDKTGRITDTASAFGPYSITIGDQNGLPVRPDGTASAFVLGVYGVTPRFSGETRSPTSASLMTTSGENGDGYNYWMRTPVTITETNSACRPSGIVTWKEADNIWRVLDASGRPIPLSELDVPTRTQGAPWFLATHRQMVIENTARLKDVGLTAKMFGASLGAVCDGKSWGPAGEHPVGSLELGGDIIFRLRSGPVGNRCGFMTTGGYLNNGARLISIEYVLERNSDKCGLNQNATLPQDVLNTFFQVSSSFVTVAWAAISAIVTGEIPSVGMSLDRVTRQIKKPLLINRTGVKASPSIHGWLDPYMYPGDYGETARTAWMNRIQSTVGVMECGMAGSNDNVATLRLQRAVVEVPVGFSAL